jgi:hypothetical protein
MVTQEVRLKPDATEVGLAPAAAGNVRLQAGFTAPRAVSGFTLPL